LALSSEQIEYAKSLLKSEGINEIFQALEDQYVSAWKNCNWGEHELKNEYHSMVKAVAALRVEIESIAKSEDIAKFNSRLAKTNRMR